MSIISTMKVEQWVAYVVAFLLALNFFLLFLPLINDSSSNWILIVTYGTAIVAVYESVIHKQSKFISLIVVTLMIHLVSDSCKVLSYCVAHYDAADYTSLETYVTLYGMLHLICYVSFETKQVEIAVPILVFASLIACNLKFDSVVLMITGLVCFVYIIIKADKYHLVDLSVFIICIFLASLFYFIKVDKNNLINEEGNGMKRFFVFFYFIAFTLSTGIKQEGIISEMRFIQRCCGVEGNKIEDKDEEQQPLLFTNNLQKNQIELVVGNAKKLSRMDLRKKE